MQHLCQHQGVIQLHQHQGGGASASALQGDSSQPRPSMVSPARQQQRSDETPKGDNFLSILICLITQEPPIAAVTCVIRGDNNHISPQVFEYSELFRMITVRGSGTEAAVNSVLYPTMRTSIQRDHATRLMKPVSPELQARITLQQRLLGLTLVDDNPIVQANLLRYTRTLEVVFSP